MTDEATATVARMKRDDPNWTIVDGKEFFLGRDADLFRSDEFVGQAAAAVDKMTQEQFYQRSLELGLPRNLRLEAKLDMSKVQLPDDS